MTQTKTLNLLKTMQFQLVSVFICATMMSNSASAPTNEGGNAAEQINGQTLLDVGSQFNITILKVFGKVIANLENDVREAAGELCRLHPCSFWSQWSFCDVSADKQGQVGAKSRTRRCGGNTTLCERYGKSRVVYDYEVCEKDCPDDYSVTEYGFCLKYYAGPKTWDEAEAVCRNDGGHLVHVDSELKAHDVNATLLENSLSGIRVWIDGRKSVQDEPWTFGYKSTNSSFTYWGDNDPDNGPLDLCMMYHQWGAGGNVWRWFDFTCSYKYQFVCQIAINDE